jgi:hypothetical protein
MKSTSKTFSRNGMTESLDTVVVKELELNEGKIVVFSCVSATEQLNFAEFATEAILRSLPIRITDNFFTALPSCFEEVNQSLLDKHLETGVSMVVMLEQNGECYLGWVGEVGVLLRTEEQLHLLTEGQTLEEMLDAADLDSDEAHHQLFELQRKKIALGVEAHLGAAIKTLLLHPKKGDFILFVTKNLQDQLLDSELEGVTDVVQLSILLQTLLIEASINSPTKSFACTTVYIDESEHAVSITEHLFSEVSSFSDNKVEQIANEVATSEVIEIENSSNMKFYVLGIVITFLVSFGVIVLLGGSKKSIENKLITTMRLEELLDAKMSEQLLYSKNDTLLISFQGKTHEIYVSDGKVITPKEKANLSTKITVKKEGEEVEVKTKKESKEEDKKAIEGIKEEKVKKEEDTKENKAEEKQEKDPIKALKKNNYVHTVEKGEGFTFITKKYSKSHPNLTQKKLIEFNLKSDKFVGSKKELEKGNLQIGMELEIPKE